MILVKDLCNNKVSYKLLQAVLESKLSLNKYFKLGNKSSNLIIANASEVSQ